MEEREVTPDILAVLQSMELFKGRDRDELTEWLGKAPFESGAECALRSHPANAFVYQEGGFGNSFFILIRGSVVGTLGPEAFELARLGPGTFFGEVELISGRARGVSVRTLEPCTAIEVPRRVFELWMRKPGPFRNVIDQTYTERGLAIHLRLFLGAAKIDTPRLIDLTRRVKLRIYSRDQAIVREGEVADSFYMLREGYVRVVKKMSGGEQRTIAYLNDGGYFGEAAALAAGHHTFSVFAMGKVEAIQVPRQDLIELVNLDESLADRFQQRQSQQSDKAATSQGFVNQIVEKGVVKATSALVIHLDSCTRCGNCVKACAELHDGVSRLTRRGMFFELPGKIDLTPEPLLVTTSCMHCLDPECMIGCPTGAISRDVNGEVVIFQDSCIGCTNCARRCPYGNISMADVPEKEIARQASQAPLIGGYLKFWRRDQGDPEVAGPVDHPTQKAVVRRVAVKCDLCHEYNYNHGCVHNCPYGAIERVEKLSEAGASE